MMLIKTIFKITLFDRFLEGGALFMSLILFCLLISIFFTVKSILKIKTDKEASKKIINMGVKKVIITLGDKGLFYSDGKEEIYLKATSVQAIDTTGAGDAFNGGLAFGLSKNKPIKECLELANKVAGLSTTKLGAGDSMPFLKEVN